LSDWNQQTRQKRALGFLAFSLHVVSFVQNKLAAMVREVEETNAKVKALTDRTARQTAEAEALIAQQLLILKRVAAVLGTERERERKASGLRPKVVVPEVPDIPDDEA
jgi:hypothetical protein